MPLYRIDSRIVFPPADRADPNGLLAVGGDLRPERLLLAYRSGIFPWYEEGLPILWHSPDPRYVLYSHELHVPRSLEKRIRKAPYTIELDTRFRDVMIHCAATKRPNQKGTWITREMVDAYEELHRLGWAHSAEAYEGSELVGGLYGVCIGGAFFGESMFANAPDASKIAFVTLVRALDAWGVDLVDCQVKTTHLERFGGQAWPRRTYLAELGKRLGRATPMGPWRLDPSHDRRGG